MKVTKILAILTSIIAIVGFGYGCINYLNLKQEYDDVNNTYTSVINECIEDSSQFENIENDENLDEESEQSFKIDWEELKTINEDVVAWIKIDGTRINYPIVQGTTNEQYIKTNVIGKYSKGGSIFVDSAIENPFKSSNTILYGHNLNDGAMFNNLKNYSNEQYANNHREIQIYLPDSDEGIIYEVFAFCKVQEDNLDFYKTEVQNLEEYYKEIENYNRLDMAKTLDYTKPLLMLSTCTNENKAERYVVFAHLR